MIRKAETRDYPAAGEGAVFIAEEDGRAVGFA